MFLCYKIILCFVTISGLKVVTFLEYFKDKRKAEILKRTYFVYVFNETV